MNDLLRVLLVEDDDQGFDPDEPVPEKGSTKGLGLVSMAGRAELSGGLFSIESAKNKGTTVRASWRLE